MKKTIVVAVLCCTVLLLSAAQAAATVDPSDPGILYTGRWDDSNPSQPWSYWIGSSIIVEFEGPGIQALMAAGDSGRPDYLRVIVDGDAAGSMKIPVAGTPATYTLASGLAAGVHRVEIVKETDIGRWSLSLFELDDGGTLIAPAARPSLKMVFYGDSNLAGYSLESEQNQGDDELRGCYHSYAGIAGRMLGAEYQNISRSGATISSIHGVFDRIDYGTSTPLYDFTLFPADVVVVNVGANDVGRPVFKIKDDYHALLDDLRVAHPESHIMLYNSWGWSYDEPANFIHEVIAERADPDMSWAIFPWIFEQWHGCEYDHAGMAQTLADHLTATLGWTQGTRDVMNGFAMYGDLANGSFEEIAPFGGYGWRYYTEAGVSRVQNPAGAHDGDFHLRLADTASVHQPFPARDGDPFALVLWLRGAENGDEVDITLDFRDQEMWTTPLQTETETFHITDQWLRFSMTATAPTGAANPVYHGRVTFTAAAGDVIDIDGVYLVSATGVPDPGPRANAGSLAVSPNPFNPSANLEFSIPRGSHVLLNVYDVSGRQVAVLIDEFFPGGKYVKKWDGRDGAGRQVSSGTYFARIVAEEFTATRKMILLK